MKPKSLAAAAMPRARPWKVSHSPAESEVSTLKPKSFAVAAVPGGAVL